MKKPSKNAPVVEITPDLIARLATMCQADSDLVHQIPFEEIRRLCVALRFGSIIERIKYGPQLLDWLWWKNAIEVVRIDRVNHLRFHRSDEFEVFVLKGII